MLFFCLPGQNLVDLISVTIVCLVFEKIEMKEEEKYGNSGTQEVWIVRGKKTSLDFLYMVRIHNKNPERKKVKSHRFIRVCWIILE